MRLGRNDTFKDFPRVPFLTVCDTRKSIDDKKPDSSIVQGLFVHGGNLGQGKGHETSDKGQGAQEPCRRVPDFGQVWKPGLSHGDTEKSVTEGRHQATIVHVDIDEEWREQDQGR